MLIACDRAVAIDPEEQDYRFGRALARAITGNFDGATRDLQWLKDRMEEKRLKMLFQSWIEILQGGHNPFTPQMLEKFRKS